MSRAILWVALPIAQVMFPKIVHSTSKSEESNLQNIVLLGTLVMSACGAFCLPIVGPLAIRIVYAPDYLKPTLALLPWYAWAMVPLAVANVMINNLLARSLFRCVPALIVLAIVYGVTLTHFHKTPVMVLQVLGACNLVLVAVCAWFTWGMKSSPVKPAN
jgi:hypothetical protein